MLATEQGYSAGLNAHFMNLKSVQDSDFFKFINHVMLALFSIYLYLFRVSLFALICVVPKTTSCEDQFCV